MFDLILPLFMPLFPVDGVLWFTRSFRKWDQHRKELKSDCVWSVYDKEQLEEEGLSARMFMRGNTQLVLFLPPCVSATKQDLGPELW